MKLVLAALVVVCFLATATAIENPCKYCSFCDECQHCHQCPCEKPTDAPNCDMCKYCTYCKLCPLCDSVCAEDSVVASVAGSVGGWISYAKNWANEHLGFDKSIDTSNLDHDTLEADIARLKQKQEEAEKAKKEANTFFKDTAVAVLDSDTVAPFIADNAAAMIMYFAPWCGHCKSFKAELIKAAGQLSEGKIGAVDCTLDRDVCQEAGVRSYPTINFYKDGKLHAPFKGARTAEGVVAFFANPENPPPPPPPPAAEKTPFLDADDGGVTMLGDDDFASTVAEGSVLVMFYAPWCGHCKRMKADYSDLAQAMEGHTIAAVDCTVYHDLCTEANVSGFPTLKHYLDGKASTFTQGRTKSAMEEFLKFRVREEKHRATIEKSEL